MLTVFQRTFQGKRPYSHHSDLPICFLDFSAAVPTSALYLVMVAHHTLVRWYTSNSSQRLLFICVQATVRTDWPPVGSDAPVPNILFTYRCQLQGPNSIMQLERVFLHSPARAEGSGSGQNLLSGKAGGISIPQQANR